MGVSWHKVGSSWRVQLTDPQTKRQRHIGNYASEDDTAKAYDYAAVQARGQGAKRIFPGEVIIELPETVRAAQKQHQSSCYVGVTWLKANSSWQVRVTDPNTKPRQYVGCYASDREEDAARAYDCAAMRMHGPGALRNFPAEAASEAPATAGAVQMQRTSSRYIGVSWYKPSCSWHTQLQDPQTKYVQHVGCFGFEEDAARAYDREAVKVLGPRAKRNLPDEGVSSESQGGKRTRL